MWSVDVDVVEKLRGKLTGSWIGNDIFEPPSEAVLRELLQVALNASLTREEGRTTTFALAYLNSGAAQIPLTFEFAKPLEFSVETIRRLAPILDGPFAFLVVKSVDGELRVVGSLRCVQSFDVSRRELPAGVLIAARGPGDLSVSLCGHEVLRTVAGKTEWRPDAVFTDFGLCMRIQETLGIERTESAPLAPQPVLLLRLARAMLAHGHGGTILVLASECPQNFLDYRFRTEPARLPVIEQAAETEALSTTHQGWECERLVLPVRRLNDMIAAFAQLTAVDGAIVLGADLTLHGFGAVIGGQDATEGNTARRVREFAQDGKLVEVTAAARGGTRHRSAERFVAQCSGKAIAFVASQDGQLSMCWHEAGAVQVIRPIGPAAQSR